MKRLGRHRARRGVIAPLVAASVVALIVIAAFVAVTLLGAHPKVPSSAAAAPLPASSIGSSDGSATAALETTGAGLDIEVPDVAGKAVKVAEALVTAAGLTVQTRVADPAVPGVAPDAVVSQWPEAGARVQAGATIVITYQARAGLTTTATQVVVIDPGHQAKPNLGLEPIGPGSKTLKEKVSGGATGVSTLVPECDRALSIALKLRQVLVAKGVKVVMVRMSSAVDIPNSERARIGNRAKADLVVRVHMGTATDPALEGAATQYPAGNKWAAPISVPSKAAARFIQDAVVGATGAADRGLEGRADMSGFNYSTRPTVMVECGMLSNSDEDKLLATAAYQQKLADGIAAGVMEFLKTR